MLRIKTFTFNPFQENTYVLYNDEKYCWIIDPGMYDEKEREQLFRFIEEEQLTPKAIINTHAHIDHIFGVAALQDKYKIPFYLHKQELPILQSAQGSAMLFGLDFPSTPKADHFFENEIIVGDDRLILRHVPGHSPGSVLLYCEPEKWALSGDVLFSGSIGRTDLPGGSMDTLLQSIRSQVLTLPDDVVIYPGHGPKTDVRTERKSNPFLQDI